MKKYFTPINQIIEFLCEKYSHSKKILEIGPGNIKFPIATHFIDHTNYLNSKNTVCMDIENTKLPFDDNEFDFIYCRHVIEDLHNIDFVLKEISRIGKSGYIECPSIMAELCRHIEFDTLSYRGYCHHIYINWVINNKLYILPKYPLIEYLHIQENFKELEDMFFWNTYYLWNNNIDFKLYKHGINFKLQSDYYNIICNAIKNSCNNILQFKNEVINNETHRWI